MELSGDQTLSFLNQRRIDLLEQLGAAYDNSDLAAVWPKVFNEYNSVIEAINKTLQLWPLAKLDDLPDEILLDIFRLVALTGPCIWKERIYMVLAFVCTRWRDLVFGTSSLWTVIHIDDNVPDLRATVTLFLKLSGGLPLSLSYERPMKSTHPVLSLILPHTHRFTSLEVRLMGRRLFSIADDKPSDRNLTRLDRLLRVTAFSSVTSFSVTNGVSPLTSQTLQSIVKSGDTIGANCVIRALEAADDSPTHVDFSVKRMQELYRTLHSIESISSITSVVVDSLTLSPNLSSNQLLDATHTQLLHWKSLTCRVLIPQTLLSNLIDRSASTLTYLNVVLDTSQFVAISLALLELSSLRSLIIDIPEQVPYPFRKYPTVLPDLKVSKLRVLKINHRLLADVGLWAYIISLLSLVPHVQKLCIPPVAHNAEYQLTKLNDELFDRICAMKSLNCLKLDGNLELVDKGDSMLYALPVVEDLAVRSTLHTFRMLKLETMLRLKFDWESSIRYANTFELYGHRLRVLELSRVTRREADKIYIRLMLPNLRRLVTNDSALLAGICYKLAVEPQHLPALEELEIGNEVFPEWDLFFVMLEKRIVEHKRRGSSVRMLEKLIFHTSLSSSLRWALTGRLKGLYTHRSSNTEICPAANYKLRLDDRIPGCERCLRILISCDAPVSRVGDESAGLDIIEIDEAITADVLEAWPTRRTYSQGSGRRYSQCRSTMGMQLVEISRYDDTPELEDDDDGGSSRVIFDILGHRASENTRAQRGSQTV